MNSMKAIRSSRTYNDVLSEKITCVTTFFPLLVAGQACKSRLSRVFLQVIASAVQIMSTQHPYLNFMKIYGSVEEEPLKVEIMH